MQYFLSSDYYLLSLILTIIFFLVNISLFFYHLKKSNNSSKLFISDILYLLASFVFITISRLYTLDCEITNIDESFHLAIALAFSKDQHFWIGFDPSSVGPVNTLIFYIVSLFTGEMSYFTAKLTALLVILFAQLFMYLAMIKIAPRSIVVPLLSCFSFYMVQPWSAPLVSYNSEFSLLLSLSLFLFLFTRFETSKIARILSFGVLALMPFCKLQFAPLGLFFYVICLWKLFKLSSSKKSFFREFVFVILISSIPPLIVIIDCFVHDSFVWFYRFFFLNMVSYVDVKVTFEGYIQNLIDMGRGNFFIISTSLLVIVLSIYALLLKHWKIVLFVWAILCISLYEIIKPNFPFFHYLNILLLPLIFSVACLLGVLNKKVITIVLSVIALLYQLIQVTNFDENFDYKSDILKTSNSQSFWKDIALDIKKMSKQEDRLVVWGWVDELYVYSQLSSGTAEIAIGGFVPSNFINRHYPSYTLEKYKDDLLQNKPRFFVDTPSPITKVYNSYEYSVKNHKEIGLILDDYYQIKKQYFFAIDSVLECDFVLNNSNQKGCVVTLYELKKQ